MTSIATTQPGFLEYERTVGYTNMQGRGFYYPVGVAFGMDGKLYVLGRGHEGDTLGVRVTICDMDGGYDGNFASVGDEDGNYIWGAGIAVDSQGLVYVSDEYLQRISVYDAAGAFLSKWGAPGDAPGELDGPSGMAFDTNDDLYLVDHRNNRVQKFSKDGELILSFGSEGNGDAELNLPWGLTVAPAGDIYVADWRNDRVQRFDPDGGFIAAYGHSGDGAGEFYRPSGVDVDAEGYIYVADWGNQRVQVLDPHGAFVTALRGQATLSPWARDFFAANPDEATAREKSDLDPDPALFGPDQHVVSSHIEKLFWAPVSVKIDPEGRLLVVDRNRHRIQVYVRP